MNLDLITIDDNVIAQIKGQVATLNNQVESLDSEEELLKTTTEKLPKAFTLVDGGQWEKPLGVSKYQEGQVRVAIYIKTRNVRGEGKARKEATKGAYALIGEIGTALLGFEPTACGPLWLTFVGPIEITKRNAIYVMRFVADTEESY